MHGYPEPRTCRTLQYISYGCESLSLLVHFVAIAHTSIIFMCTFIFTVALAAHAQIPHLFEEPTSSIALGT